MKSHTEYMTFNTDERREFIRITENVQGAVDAAGAQRMGIAGAVYPADELMPRAVELAGRIASAPRQATTQTKRRILLDRDRTIGHLFDEEERLLREALLGDDPDEAA